MRSADRSRLAGWVVGLSTLVATSAAAAATPASIVTGEDRALLLPPAGAEVTAYENAGYRLTLVEGAAQVTVDLSPLGSSAPFLPQRPDGAEEPIGRLARSLTVGSQTQHEAVTRALAWIASHVRYELDRDAPQDAASVLARRSGYCTGFARLAVAVLGAVGIEAREVAGYVVGELPGNEPRRSGFHRWIEVRYPDVGWVFSDPLATLGYVPASYLRLASDELASDTPGPGLLLGRADRTAAVDVAPVLGGSGLRMRPNRPDRRTAAALMIELESGRDGEAVLEGGGHLRRLPLPGGTGTFLGLEPGSYRLRVSEGGRVAAWKEITFRDRVFAEMRIPEIRAPESSGAVR